MSVGDYDHPISWCFGYFPREGMIGMYEHLRKAWGPSSGIACDHCKRLYEQNHLRATNQESKLRLDPLWGPILACESLSVGGKIWLIPGFPLRILKVAKIIVNL